MTDPDRERLIAQILDAQRHMQRLFVADRSDPLFDSHLTLPQLKILLLLASRGGTSGQEFARTLHVSLATVTGIVDRLVAQNLVARHEDPRDRRVRIIELTPVGRTTVDRIITAGVERQQRVLSRLSTADLETVHRAVTVLIETAAAETGECRARVPESGQV
ncbi:MarR family winged helix-turn-helix transcriptional regulator [Rhizomonospora bruguierae]|uniref:MarR family winged helix-turn-helix transcriptional regulator n=1 Tax=Rhizomonospora bruguierae TaxID=1581705 RepID=UPI0020C0CC74|nr:MarR family transcriptional regulator [Micromonospora sp. NBRC 107566]